MMPAAGFTTEQAGGHLTLTAQGRWVTAEAAPLDRALRRLRIGPGGPVIFDFSGLAALDTTGAWLIERTRRALQAGGSTVEISHLPPDLVDLVERVGHSVEALGVRQRPPARQGLLERIGRGTVRMFDQAYALLSFVGRVSVESVKVLALSRRLRWIALFNQIERAGLDALPILGLLSFLIGVVFAFQGADQLSRFGAQIFVVNLLGLTVLREMGVLLTAIIVAGRSGSAFTAEIGSMRVNDEVDALQTMGVNIVEALVLPRLLALVVILPLLAFYADVMALMGGMFMSYVMLDIAPSAFIDQLHVAVRPWTFWIGLIKAPVFGLIIATVGCFQGLQVEHNAESVGRLTTLSVVESIFFVIIVDAIFSVLFSLLRV